MGACHAKRMSDECDSALCRKNMGVMNTCWTNIWLEKSITGLDPCGLRSSQVIPKSIPTRKTAEIRCRYARHRTKARCYDFSYALCFHSNALINSSLLETGSHRMVRNRLSTVNLKAHERCRSHNHSLHILEQTYEGLTSGAKP